MSRIEGMAALEKALQGLKEQASGRVLRSATMAAAMPIVRAARANIPKGRKGHKTYKGRYVAPGFSSRSIKRKSRLSRDKSRVEVSIGVKREAYYAVAFVELGTRKMRKQPWLRPAMEGSQNESLAVLKEKLRTGIERERRKAMSGRR